MTRYVTVADVVAYQEALVHAEGQPPAPLIAPEKLASAVARPQATGFGEELFSTLQEKAAALLQAVVIAHPFLDGNKRAGLAAMLLFLRLSGVGPGRALRPCHRRHYRRDARSAGDSGEGGGVVRDGGALERS